MTKQDIACAVWDLTIPCDQITTEDLKERFNEHCKKWAFQKEKGDQTGYLHYQCRVSMQCKMRMKPMIELFEDIKARVTKTSTTNTKNNFYVIKEDTRIEGPWTNMDLYIPKQWRNPPERWYAWQEKVIEILDTEPDLRKIHVIVDPEGNNGKSTLTGYLACRNLIRKIPCMNDFKDIMRLICDTPPTKAYFIDIPRALDKSKLKNFYGAIEEIKNGYAFDERYEFKERHFDTPHVFVFTNVEPDYNLLSIDRWVIWRISKMYNEREPIATQSVPVAKV